MRSSHTAASRRDRDNDGDHNDDDAQFIYYGHAAGAAERAAVVALVQRFYAAAIAKNGVAGCRLLTPRIREQVVEEDGSSPKLRGHTCPVVLAKLFAAERRELLQRSAAMKVEAVRIQGGKGVALIEFSRLHEVRQLAIRRVGDTWLLHDARDRFIE